MATFGAGQSVAIAQLALATFNNPKGLVKLGSSRYGESQAAGIANVGVAGAGGRGTLIGSALEGSNVDIAQEFTQHDPGAARVPGELEDHHGLRRAPGRDAGAEAVIAHVDRTRSGGGASAAGRRARRGSAWRGAAVRRGTRRVARRRPAVRAGRRDAAAVPQAFDQRALIGWLLVGSPVDATTEMPSAVEAAPSETEGVDDEEPESVELEDDAGLEIPADVLLAAPTAPQQPVIVETVAIPVEAARQQPAEPIRLQDAKDARPAGDATPAAAESAQAKTAQAAPLRAVRAAEPQTAFQLEPEAASPDAAIEPDMSESRDAMLQGGALGSSGP